MTFHPDKLRDFVDIFNGSREHIRDFEGCQHLELLNDVSATHVFFTLSVWRSEKDLENYRSSELFSSTWSKTKVLFSEKPEAWTLNQTSVLK